MASVFENCKLFSRAARYMFYATPRSFNIAGFCVVCPILGTTIKK